MTERERIRWIGLPRRTYQVARGRLLETGVLIDSYVPNPILFGCSRLSVGIGDFNATVLPAARVAWSQAPALVHLLQAQGTLLGVFLEPGSSPTVGAMQALVSGPPPARSSTIVADLREATAPVYFDFEAAWNRVCGNEGTSNYPRSIPNNPGPLRPRAPTLPSVQWKETMLQLCSQRVGTRPWPGARVSRRTLRNAVEQAWIEPRTFLAPWRLQPYRGWMASHLVLVFGELAPGADPAALFRSLVGGAKAAPYLMVTDFHHVLLGLLAPAPPISDRNRPTASVAATVSSYVPSPTVYRLPLPDVTAIVNHAYGRLLRRPALAWPSGSDAGESRLPA